MIKLYKKHNKSEHLDCLSFLRGAAAVMVCFCHFGGALTSPKSPYNAVFMAFHQYGKYGVHMFFVISGFVIPLSFESGNYTIKKYFTFLYKRILRLHPPYLLAVILTLVIMAFSYGVRHMAFPENYLSILKICFYMSVPPDNPVFWSLLVEIQYYIFIGLFYAAIYNYPKTSSIVLIPILILLSRINFLSQHIMLLSYLCFFLIGLTGYLIYKKKGSMPLNLCSFLIVVSSCFVFYDQVATIFSLITIAIILFYKRSIPKPFLFLGTISYSLYLIHFPIGIKIINLIKSHISLNYDSLLFVFVFTLVLIISWLFYLLIERSSETLSRKIKY